MTYGTYAPRSYARSDRGWAARSILPQLAPSAVIAVCAVVGGLLLYEHEPAGPAKIELAASSPPASRPATFTHARPTPFIAPAEHASVRQTTAAPAPAAPSRTAILATPYTGLLDPAYSFGVAPVTFALNTLPQSRFTPSGEPAAALSKQVASLEQAPSTEPGAPPAESMALPAETKASAEPEAVTGEPKASPIGSNTPPLQQDAQEFIPLPLPRPPMLRLPTARMPLRAAMRRLARQEVPLATTPPPDRRTFFEKLFQTEPAPGPVLAYASPEDGFFSRGVAPARGLPPDRWTAVYDISAHTVYLPNGTRLEAHSGLRDKIDDPRFVALRMRGPTPPAIYDLTPRESLFHGVQALRLTPVGGNIYGRSGLLAHTYMLGPSGQSNGCVSFRNYTAFLQAYQRGEIRRLIVVARLS